jgi:hypothetical protein
MATAAERRLTLLDMMILLAASAPGLVLLRPGSPTISSLFGWNSWLDVTLPGTDWMTRWQGGPGFTMDLMIDCADAVLPFLATGTTAILAMRWIRPRLAWRGLVQQPGLAACAAATVGLFAMLWLGSYRVRLASLLPGSLVGVVWLGLAASRCWHPERFTSQPLLAPRAVVDRPRGEGPGHRLARDRAAVRLVHQELVKGSAKREAS